MNKLHSGKPKDISRLFFVFVFLTIFIFGILPGTCMGVKVTESEPKDQSEDISVESWIIIRFNNSMEKETVDIEISPSLKPYGYRTDWNDDETELTIKPNTGLTYEEKYTITIENAEDIDGNEMNQTIIVFTTEDEPSMHDMVSGMFSNIWGGFIDIVPNLLLLVVILVIGYIIAKVAAWAFSKALEKLGFNNAMDKVGVGKQLKSIGIKSASKFLGIFVFWFIFVIVLQIAIAAMGITSITNILAPIVLFIPRILIAAIIILIGMYIANFIAQKIMEQMGKTEIGKTLKDVDKRTTTSGFSMISIVSMFIKIFILLFFVQIALEIVNIGLLSEFITPVLLLMPLILVAFFIILIGLVVTEIVRKAVIKLIEAFEIKKLIAPVEETIGKKGIILDIFLLIIKVIIMLIFIQLAIGVLNSTGAFDQLAELINMAVLWMPNVLAALVILMVGFWFAGWVSGKILKYAKQVEAPFPQTMAIATKFLIMYLAGVMAIAQMGFKVDILYMITAIVLGAVFLGLGIGFAFGSKDIFANLGGYFQNNKVLKVGNKVNIDGKYSGKIFKIDHYSTTLLNEKNEQVIIPNSQLTKAVIVDSSPPPATLKSSTSTSSPTPSPAQKPAAPSATPPAPPAAPSPKPGSGPEPGPGPGPGPAPGQV
jgi:small-conductance mechanosensitive channel